MVGWHHRLDGHESEQTQRDTKGQGRRVLQSMGLQRLDMTEPLNNSRSVF